MPTKHVNEETLLFCLLRPQFRFGRPCLHVQVSDSAFSVDIIVVSGAVLRVGLCSLNSDFQELRYDPYWKKIHHHLAEIWPKIIFHSDERTSISIPLPSLARSQKGIFTCGALVQRRSSSCLLHLLHLPKFQNEFLKALNTKFNMESYAIWDTNFKSEDRFGLWGHSETKIADLNFNLKKSG